MKVGRCIVTLAYNDRIEVEEGVWENNLKEVDVKAQSVKVYQSRVDFVNIDNLQVTNRLRVRSHLVPSTDLDYAILRGRKYKVLRNEEEIGSHWTVIDLGELL